MRIEQDYKLKISVDVGYSASKICVNGVVLFTIPSNIVEITGNENYLLGIRQPNYISTSYVQGQKYLVGEQAATLLMEQNYRDAYNEIKETMSSYDRFKHANTITHLMTCIGMALIKYSQYTMENNVTPKFDVTKDLGEKSLFEIFVILGFPHDICESTLQIVKPRVVGEHKFDIETEDDEYNLQFFIDKEHVMAFSQAQAAYMGTVLDEKGQLISNSEHFKKLPALLLDGGMKTVGKFVLTKTASVEQAESNTDYAMDNVYRKVVDYIRKEYGREDIEVYNIEQILRNEGGRLVAKKNGTTEVVNIKKIYEQYRNEVCEGLIEYLNKEHNNLLNIEEILIAGGTGAEYYDSFMDYIEREKGHLEKDVRLIDYVFNNAPIDPVYAVAVGLYKTLLHNIVLYELGKSES